MVKQIASMQEFEKLIKEAGDAPVLIDFHATWCGPCKMIAPELEKLAAKYPKMLVYKVDVDEAEDIAQKYEIDAMPSFKMIKNGAVVGTVVGANVQKLEELIKDHN
jgi:thioredoxin 1